MNVWKDVEVEILMLSVVRQYYFRPLQPCEHKTQNTESFYFCVTAIDCTVNSYNPI